MYAYNMQHLNTAVICREIILQNHRTPKSSSYTVQSHDGPKLLYHIMNHHRLPNISSAFNFAKPTVQPSLPSYLYNELQKRPQRWLACWQALIRKVRTVFASTTVLAKLIQMLSLLSDQKLFSSILVKGMINWFILFPPVLNCRQSLKFSHFLGDCL